MSNLTTSSLFCLLGLAVALPAQEHDLRIQGKKGASVWLSQHEKTEQVIDMAGQEMETANDRTMVVQYTVKEVEDNGTLVVETKIARVFGSMTMPMLGDIDFDSAKPAADDDEEEDAGGFGMPSQGQIVKAQTRLAGKAFVAKVSPDGKVASLEGVEEILKGEKAGGPFGAIKEEELKSVVETAFGALPGKPVAVGASWDHQGKDTGMMPAASLKMTLDKVDDEAFEVKGSGTIDPPKSKGDANDPRAQMMESLKISNSKVDGLQRVSRKDGFVLEASNSVAVDATMESPMGGEMGMKVKSVTTVKRTTAEAAAKPAAPTPTTGAPKDEKKEDAPK